ncbi:MAG TPA: Fic family protein [Methanosarcinaceae archaeon]|nr:Fic family protein [Methanosarcinaceae archaeon]
MDKLEIKTIKGNKYLYIKYKLKVNNKSTYNSLYVGRLEKLSLQDFILKLDELQDIRLNKFTDFWIGKQRQFLDDNQTVNLEAIHYNYRLFSEHFPDELEIYNNSVFTHYVQGTTAIEGNTITQRQVDELFEHGITPPSKPLREVYEIVNFKKLRSFFDNYKGDVSEKLIREVHAIIMNDLLESAGVYRRIQVLIEKAEHQPPPAFEISEMMEELVKWYRKNRDKMHPFELAILLHTKLVTIHPFVDGNGRGSRALMNFVLEKIRYPTIYFGIEHRNDYLDAVAEGNDGQYRPIVDLLYDIYAWEHEQVITSVQDGLSATDVQEQPEMKSLIDRFLRLRNV